MKRKVLAVMVTMFFVVIAVVFLAGQNCQAGGSADPTDAQMNLIKTGPDGGWNQARVEALLGKPTSSAEETKGNPISGRKIRILKFGSKTVTMDVDGDFVLGVKY